MNLVEIKKKKERTRNKILSSVIKLAKEHIDLDDDVDDALLLIRCADGTAFTIRQGVNTEADDIPLIGLIELAKSQLLTDWTII